MADEWYYRRNDQEYGPFSSQQLKQRAASGELAPNDLIRRSDMEKWIEARQVKGLNTQPAQEQTAATPPPPPPIPAQPSTPPSIVTEVPSQPPESFNVVTETTPAFPQVNTASGKRPTKQRPAPFFSSILRIMTRHPIASFIFGLPTFLLTCMGCWVILAFPAHISSPRPDSQPPSKSWKEFVEGAKRRMMEEYGKGSESTMFVQKTMRILPNDLTLTVSEGNRFNGEIRSEIYVDYAPIDGYSFDSVKFSFTFAFSQNGNNWECVGFELTKESTDLNGEKKLITENIAADDVAQVTKVIGTITDTDLNMIFQIPEGDSTPEPSSGGQLLVRSDYRIMIPKESMVEKHPDHDLDHLTSIKFTNDIFLIVYVVDDKDEAATHFNRNLGNRKKHVEDITITKSDLLDQFGGTSIRTVGTLDGKQQAGEIGYFKGKKKGYVFTSGYLYEDRKTAATYLKDALDSFEEIEGQDTETTATWDVEPPNETPKVPIASDMRCSDFVALIAEFRNVEPLVTENYNRPGYDGYFNMGGSNSMVRATVVHNALGNPARTSVRKQRGIVMTEQDWIYECKDGNVSMEVYYNDSDDTVGFLAWVYVKN